MAFPLVVFVIFLSVESEFFNQNSSINWMAHLLKCFLFSRSIAVCVWNSRWDSADRCKSRRRIFLHCVCVWHLFVVVWNVSGVCDEKMSRDNVFFQSNFDATASFHCSTPSMTSERLHFPSTRTKKTSRPWTKCQPPIRIEWLGINMVTSKYCH